MHAAIVCLVLQIVFCNTHSKEHLEVFQDIQQFSVGNIRQRDVFRSIRAGTKIFDGLQSLICVTFYLDLMNIAQKELIKNL